MFFYTDINHKSTASKVVPPSNFYQFDDCVSDNVIVRCIDDGASEDRAENYSISGHGQVTSRRYRVQTSNAGTCKCLESKIFNHLQLM